MYEIKKGAPLPSDTKYPWDQMEVTDHFECDFCELNTLMQSVKKMQMKRPGFSVEIAKCGDTLMVWLVSRGKELTQPMMLETRIIEMLSKNKNWISEGVFYNRIKWASRESIKKILDDLVLNQKVLKESSTHPRKKFEFDTYRIA